MDEGVRTVAGWELEEKLGAGGFGEVWRARRRHVGMPRALKLLPVTDQRAFTSWRHEIDRLEELSHPHIVRFYDADVVADPSSRYDGFAWIATELCERSLADELDRRVDHVLERGVERLVDQMLDALAAAHGRSCVHRDVKPANILWHASGVWKLADFGTARLVPDGAGDAQTAVVGTVPYMSPAAHRGHQDYAADLYALGVTVHEALCGERLHPRPGHISDSEYIKFILDTPPRISDALDTRWRTVVGALVGGYGPVGAAELHDWFERTRGDSGPPPPGGLTTDQLPDTEPQIAAVPPTVPAQPPRPRGVGPGDDTIVDDTQVQRAPPTVRQPNRPPTPPPGLGPRSSRSRPRRHERDIPVGPLAVFGVSAVVAGVLLLSAGMSLVLVLGIVVGSVALIALVMALN